MKLPKGYKANVYPRSSTYKNFGIILANSVGQIDNSYSGDNDEWRFPAIALRDTVIHKNDRICQFEIQKIQPEIQFEEVDHLDEVSRGGIGSTGNPRAPASISAPFPVLCSSCSASCLPLCASFGASATAFMGNI